jgi:hypothetical protein
LLGIANGVFDVEAPLEAIVARHLDRKVDYCPFLQANIDDFSERHLEHGIVPADRVDVRFD